MGVTPAPEMLNSGGESLGELGVESLGLRVEG